jgi:hypothetical protein
MSQFIYLYRNGERPQRSAEQMQQEMQQWMTWLKALTDKGHVKDPGHPLERSGKVVKGTSRTVTDGPFAEAKDLIGGYTLIEAKDIGQAVDLSAGCPIFEAGGSVEVRPVMSM